MLPYVPSVPYSFSSFIVTRLPPDIDVLNSPLNTPLLAVTLFKVMLFKVASFPLMSPDNVRLLAVMSFSVKFPSLSTTNVSFATICPLNRMRSALTSALLWNLPSGSSVTKAAIYDFFT